MERTMTYRTLDVPVRGGMLRVGEWTPADPDAPVVVAAHGITASHLAWATIADALPEVRFVAPDLRGRGRSNGLPGPFGMVQHAEDLAAVSEHLGLDRALVVGHSMGGFVALASAHLYPERFTGPLLVDGGLPLRIPDGVTLDELMASTLGPAMARLSMTFPDRAAYLEFWGRHPAFAANWTQDVVDYANYDLEGTEPNLRPSTSYDAVAADSGDQFGGGVVADSLAALTHPVQLLVAPRGFLDDPPGLYDIAARERARTDYPFVQISEVADVNHYTIVLSPQGADAVVEALRAELAALS
ncbi:alpha/beta hydrolase [Diaminobutyricibacter tongyongensis]|uniref:Alpha/beta hydrolase n=2 Tax=Leifsonia tongyongensis TaxID=1268043 RepID=A0A6L9XT97_9MICO|nr:alpha/beta hydrolase [Diaminobutyricibacter tongyongensis]